MFDGADWTTILVALATGTTAAAGPIGMKWWSDRKEKTAIKAALFAEISALKEIVLNRGYLSGLHTSEQNLLLRRHASPFTPDAVSPIRYIVAVPADYNLIYRANTEKLGALSPDEARKVVRFYQLIQSVVADVGPGGASHEGTTNPAVFAESRRMLEQAMELADDMCRAAKG